MTTDNLDALLQAATERALTASELRPIDASMARLEGFTVRRLDDGSYTLVNPSGREVGLIQSTEADVWEYCAPYYTVEIYTAITRCWLPNFELTGSKGAWTVCVFDYAYSKTIPAITETTPTETPALAIVVARLRWEREGGG